MGWLSLEQPEDLADEAGVAPPIPAVRPAWLRSWHGKPAATRSTSGSSSSSRTSPTSGDVREAIASTACAAGSTSQSSERLVPGARAGRARCRRCRRTGPTTRRSPRCPLAHPAGLSEAGEDGPAVRGSALTLGGRAADAEPRGRRGRSWSSSASEGVRTRVGCCGARRRSRARETRVEARDDGVQVVPRSTTSSSGWMRRALSELHRTRPARQAEAVGAANRRLLGFLLGESNTRCR